MQNELKKAFFFPLSLFLSDILITFCLEDTTHVSIFRNEFMVLQLIKWAKTKSESLES